MSPAAPLPLSRVAALLALSGAAALTCEVVWLRRLALLLGGSGLATTLTLSLYMVGLGGGAWLAGRPGVGARVGMLALYGRLELAAAAWALAFPWLAAAVEPLAHRGGLGTATAAAALLLVPPGLVHGATLPAAVAAVSHPAGPARLYASNTAGAVCGTLLASFVLLPLLGVRSTELVAAAAAATAGGLALSLRAATPAPHAAPAGGTVSVGLLAAAAASGLAALALEVCLVRLGALLMGGSVYAFAIVLAVFLAGIAGGAAVSARLAPRGPARALVVLALLGALGTVAWRILPHGLGAAYALAPGLVLPAGALLLAVAMAGAPVASGVALGACLDIAGRAGRRAVGAVLAANTAGCVVGSAVAGLWALPSMGLRGTAMAACAIAAAVGVVLARQRRVPLVLAALTALVGVFGPRWDPALYAVGLYARLDQFADLSPAAIEAFAHDGWSLDFYRDGRSTTVAVGRSTTTGRRWLSLNGKVDASDGDDMPTQWLSGELPVQAAQATQPGAPDVLVVGLASGVTAHAALATGARSVTVVELEPAVLDAAHHFSHVNGDLLADPRATVVVADARAVLSGAAGQVRTGDPTATDADRRWQVIISEPSNPWLTGVSNLFTREYWELARARLADDGVFCQWLQLYSLPPEAMRSLVRTFTEVFPNAVMIETVPGADALLVALPPGSTWAPASTTLTRAGLDRLAGRSAGPLLGLARLNTDDRPWIEFEAPKWLLRPTAAENRAAIERAAR